MYSRDKIIDTMKEIYSESKTIKPYVVVAQPRRDLNETAAQNFDGYEGLHIDMMGFSHGFCNIGGEKVDVARNYLIEQALESGAKYLLFVGEDTVLPYDGFKKLMRTAEANPNSVVTGVYYIKCSDAMIMVREGDWITIPNVDPGQVIEAWQTGMDVMLIPISLLKEMKEEAPDVPFCCIGNNINDEIPFIGEDNFFVHRLHKRGTKLLVNTDVQCLHMDLATGMYTAHPSVDLTKYYTNIKPTRSLTLDDKEFIDRRWIDRLPAGTSYKSVIENKINNKEPIRFNMGSGNDEIEGYLSVDKNSEKADIKVDVLKMDLPENVTDEILASHLIEHLPQHRAPELLDKWYKTLKPKGKLIVETPHIEELCEDFLKQDDEERRVTLTCIFGAAAEEITKETQEKGALYPHLWGYTPKTLTDLCKTIGFKDVKILPQSGKHPGKNFRLEAVK
jgi:hypothetical protein